MTHAQKIPFPLSSIGNGGHSSVIGFDPRRRSGFSWRAVRALAASPHTRTDGLILLLSDSVPQARAAAALALCHHPHESAVEALVKTLADEYSLTAGLAGNAFVKIGSPSVSSLLEVMKARDEVTCVRMWSVALRALSQFRDHRAIPVMMKSLSDESALLQY